MLIERISIIRSNSRLFGTFIAICYNCYYNAVIYSFIAPQGYIVLAFSITSFRYDQELMITSCIEINTVALFVIICQIYQYRACCLNIQTCVIFACWLGNEVYVLIHY